HAPGRRRRPRDLPPDPWRGDRRDLRGVGDAAGAPIALARPADARGRAGDPARGGGLREPPARPARVHVPRSADALPAQRPPLRRPEAEPPLVDQRPLRGADLFRGGGPIDPRGGRAPRGRLRGHPLSGSQRLGEPRRDGDEDRQAAPPQIPDVVRGRGPAPAPPLRGAVRTARRPRGGAHARPLSPRAAEKALGVATRERLSYRSAPEGRTRVARPPEAGCSRISFPKFDPCSSSRWSPS